MQNVTAMLTVIMPLYNKERYVREALESVLAQHTDFGIQIIVADDCSTDGSLSIVQQIQQEHPSVIKILASKKNQKLFRNVVRAYAVIDTPYFCVLGPDDYWTDVSKLQRAVSFLETNREYTIYASDCVMLYPDGTQQRYLNYQKPKDSDFQDFLHGTAVVGNALGTVFRNVVFKDGLTDKLKGNLSKEQEDSFRGDTFLTLIHLHEGRCHYEPICDSVYRITSSGIWQSMSPLQQLVFNGMLFINMYDYFDRQYDLLRSMAYTWVKQALRKYWLLMEKESDPTAIGKVSIQIRDLLKRCRSAEETMPILSRRYRFLFWVYNFLRQKLARKGYIDAI